MTPLREAAQQALEALKDYKRSDDDRVSIAMGILQAALAEPTVPSDCTDSHQPVAWYHVPHPDNGISPVVSMFQQREPSLYGAVVPLYTAPQRCPNCASLEAQNTELDQKLAQMERKLKSLTEAVLRANGLGGK